MLFLGPQPVTTTANSMTTVKPPSMAPVTTATSTTSGGSGSGSGGSSGNSNSCPPFDTSCKVECAAIDTMGCLTCSCPRKSFIVFLYLHVHIQALSSEHITLKQRRFTVVSTLHACEVREAKQQASSSLLTLKTPRKPASENVVCLCRLLNIFTNFSNLFLHTGKQFGPWSNCS